MDQNDEFCICLSFLVDIKYWCNVILKQFQTAPQALCSLPSSLSICIRELVSSSGSDAWTCSHLDHRHLKLPPLCLWQYVVRETIWCLNNSLGGYNTRLLWGFSFFFFCGATSAFSNSVDIYMLGRVLCLMYFCPHFCSDFLFTTGCSISQAEASQSVIILFHPMSISLLYSKPLSASYLLPPGHHLKQSHSSFGSK